MNESQWIIGDMGMQILATIGLLSVLEKIVVGAVALLRKKK